MASRKTTGNTASDWVALIESTQEALQRVARHARGRPGLLSGMRESTEPWAVAICHADAVLDDLVATIADAGIGSEPVQFSGIHHASAVMAVRKACNYCLDYSDALDVDYSEVSKAIVDWTTTRFTHREVERVALHAINEVRRVPADAWKPEPTPPAKPAPTPDQLKVLARLAEDYPHAVKKRDIYREEWPRRLRQPDTLYDELVALKGLGLVTIGDRSGYWACTDAGRELVIGR